MKSVAEAYSALEGHAQAGRRFAAEELASVDLRQADEHAVANLLVLAALCGRMGGGPSNASSLYSVADRYSDSSLFYTGRLLPRAKEMIALLDRSVDERSLEGLVEVADHLSQGWSRYGESVFPAAFRRLAAESGLEPEEGAFSEPSFVLWWQALEAAARNEPREAHRLFTRSLERYRKYLYYADAAWIYTDLVAVLLMEGKDDEAENLLEEQARYVDEVLAEHPTAAKDGRPAFHVGAVQSGSYATFVESSSLRPEGITEADRTLLLRYVSASEFLIAACRFGSRKDFGAALDLFSSGWSTFQDSPYPRIFSHLVRERVRDAMELDVHLTAHERWYQMLSSYRVQVKPEVLVRTAMRLHDRLDYAGLHEQAGLVLLDAAVLDFHLQGGRTSVPWIARYLKELRSSVPEAVDTVVEHVRAAHGREERTLPGKYAGLRSDHLAPELLSAGLAEWQPSGGQPLEITLYGRLLCVSGILVYENTAPPLADILTVLGKEFTDARAKQTEPPFLSAAELSERTDRTSAALAQAVRRFRAVCQERFEEDTDGSLSPDAVIQGRPGYRLNPHSVRKFAVYSL